MAINGENGVSAVTVDELLKQGLRIPNYQRPYSWDVSTALQLVGDISEALRDTEQIFPMFWVQSFFTMMVSISM